MTANHTIENTDTRGWKIGRALSSFYILTFGVLLPLITLFVELKWAWCAGVFFDPIPSAAHVLMVGVVPIANLLGWWVSFTRRDRYLRSVLFLNGIALGVAAFYTILFLPITPLAFLALVFWIGILPLAPLLSFIAAIICRVALHRTASPEAVKPRFDFSLGIAAALVIIVGVELPATLTRIGIQMAASHEHEQQLRGVRLLRTIGNQDLMLRACYQRPGRTTDMISFLTNWGVDPISPDAARRVYYRVTGEAFNAVPPPAFGWRGDTGPTDLFPLDAEQGSDAVGGRLKGVRLNSSVFDGSIDADAALSYLEWTLEFSNDSPRLAEGRAQIGLPPGAVVSRVTLWINGEEREAAFAGRAQTRRAYQQVVSRQRDPILVTTAGADTVLLQLYPIPVNGNMKARIGITAPLLLAEAEQGVLRLPYFKERNFNIDPRFQHALWLESDAAISSEHASLLSERTKTAATALRGTLDNAVLHATNAAVRVSRDSRITQTHAIDTKAARQTLVQQTVVHRDTSLKGVVMVVDGSKSMRPAIAELSEAIRGLPEDLRFSLLLASDEVREIVPALQTGTAELYQRAAEQLRKEKFTGGVDNTPALERAWSLAAQLPNTAVLWVHGPQPVTLHSVETLRQHWRRRPAGPVVYDFPVSAAVNRIVEQLDGVSQIKTVPRIGSLSDDLSRQFALWGGERQQLTVSRSVAPAHSSKPAGRRTSDHLVRLWAYDGIMALSAEDKKDSTRRAIALATRYQLVTPVSGAVVLETQQQYKDAGLQPVSEGTVPTIPEPQTWLLIIATCLVLAWVFYHQRRIPVVARRWA